MKYIFGFMVLLFSMGIFAQKTTTGTVVGVIDGDSYKIEASYRKVTAIYRVRIVNVDAPERYFIPKRREAQEFADSIYKVVEAKLLNKEVKLTYYGVDQYNRILAFITLDGERIDQWMLKEGLAWAFKEYHPQKGYKASVKIMEQAKSQKKGLWAGSNIVEPSKWRAK